MDEEEIEKYFNDKSCNFTVEYNEDCSPVFKKKIENAPELLSTN